MCFLSGKIGVLDKTNVQRIHKLRVDVRTGEESFLLKEEKIA